MVKVVWSRLPEWMALLALAAVSPSCGGGGGSDNLATATAAAGSANNPSASASPVPMLSRSSGVAPFAVFCSAANAYIPGSTSTLIAQPGNADYSSFQYSWNFGDPGSGTWSTTGLSKNTATGFTAAHVYETPGTYTVTLTLTDAAGAVSIYTQNVVVNGFTGTTYYISSTGGSDANNGLSPGTAWQTPAKAFQNIGTNRRFLFNRGDTFNTAGGFLVDLPGPGLIGAYGAGARPLFNVTGTGGCIRLRHNDWVVSDLEFKGLGAADQAFAVTLEETRAISRSLLLRLSVHEFRVGITWSDWPTMYTTPQDNNTVAECFSFNCGVNGIFAGGKRLALLGNTVLDPGSSHVIRVWQAHQGVIAHNVALRPGGDRHSLKLHGPTFGDTRPATGFVTVSDNSFEGQVWAVVIGPQDTLHDERITQVIYERNLSTATNQTQLGVMVKGRQITLRNNIFVGTGAPNGYTAVGVGQSSGQEPPAKDVRILNNTVYRGNVVSQLGVVSFDVRCSDTTVQNNLVSMSGGTSFITVGACPGLVSDHNLATPAPGFVNAGAGNFRLAAGSPAIDTGAAVPGVKADYAGAARPAGAAYDVGAFEQ